MKFLVDNNLPPALARALHELCTTESSHGPVAVTALRDKFEAKTPDAEWIAALGIEGGWTVVSQDRFKKGNPEQEALIRARLVVFRLDHAWSNHQYWDKVQNLIRWWPSIMDATGRAKPGACFSVPWNFGGGSKLKEIGHGK